MPWWYEECFEDGLSDSISICFDRKGPVEDEEADRFESICLAATPGPLVVDDLSDGGGAVIATLADGRHIVSLTAPAAGQTDMREAAEAHARLICHARHLVSRLLQDRRQWKGREQSLLEKIRSLETELERRLETAESPGWGPADRTVSRPR